MDHSNSPAERSANTRLYMPPETPQWMRDLTNSRANRTNRHSRASSLASISTKFTTNTNADARSIDLVLGGQYFRIARDGSRVTDSAPPPYSGNVDWESYIGSSARNRSPSASIFSVESMTGRTVNEDFTIASDEEDSETDSDQDGAITPTQRSPAMTASTHHWETLPPLPETEVLLSSEDINQSRPQTALAITDVPDRSRSWKQGPDVLNVVASSSIPRKGPLRSQTFDGGDACSPGPHLRRSHGLRLPSAEVHLPGSDRSLSHLRPTRTQSAGPVLYENNVDGRLRKTRTDSEMCDPFLNARQLAVQFSRATPEDDSDDQALTEPPPMNDENDISLHYARMMRQLDRDHRRVLHQRDRELAQLRQQLHEKDVVYRQELRARDFMVDDLRKRLEHAHNELQVSQQTLEARIEKAIFQTEDVWESRWKDRDFHLRERMKRIEEDAQRTVDAILNEATKGVGENEKPS